MLLLTLACVGIVPCHHSSNQQQPHKQCKHWCSLSMLLLLFKWSGQCCCCSSNGEMHLVALKLCRECCRWAGSSQKTAEVKARPDVTEADKAVKDAMQPDKSANGSAADGHNTNGNFQHKLSAKGGRDSNAQDDQSLQSGLKSPAGLQQRTIGQSSQGPTSPQ